MKYALAILSLCLGQYLAAQSWVSGRVVDKNGYPISNVHIKSDAGFYSISGKNGRFTMELKKGLSEVQLQFSHVSFHPLTRKVILNPGDTVFIRATLQSKVYELRPAEAYGKPKPEPVFHSYLHYVHDFELIDERLLLITFNKSLRKDAALTLCDFDQKIIFELPLINKPVGLYRDFADRVFVEYERYVELITVEGDSLSLHKVNLREYFHSVKPCMDSSDSQIYFSDQIWYLPRFNYYSFDVKDSMVFLLRNVVHKEVNHMMRWEYYDMRVDDQLKAMKIASHFPDLDEQEIAGLMTGFHNSIYYEVPYAPLFVKNDTILIFDHCSDYVFRYSQALETIDSIPISYHKPKKRWTWKDQMYFDSESSQFYGLFIQNGYAYLKAIDESSGEVVQVNKLQNQFVKKIKVHDNYAYYLYKPASSPTKPFIYRELLTVAN